MLLWHGTFAINSLAHVAGRQRYVTGDDSRNNWWLAIITLGEGWHNNHHAYQSSVRQGFRWWEFDPTFYALKALSWLGIVWDLRSPPEAVIRGEQRLGRKVIEKVAHQLAIAFPLERIAALTHEDLARTPKWTELQSRLCEARSHAEAFLADLHFPHVPSVDEIRRYAEQHLREYAFARGHRRPCAADPAGIDLGPAPGEGGRAGLRLRRGLFDAVGLASSISSKWPFMKGQFQVTS